MEISRTTKHEKMQQVMWFLFFKLWRWQKGQAGIFNGGLLKE